MGELEQQLAQKDQEYPRKQIEEKYYSVINNKDPNVHSSNVVSSETQVRASKRQRCENPYTVNEITNSYTLADNETQQTAAQIKEAYRAIHSSGSTLDNMGAIAAIAKNQRRQGF